MDILKGPEDMIILSQLFWYVKPRTVIELGTFTGASAIWMANILNLSKIECNLFSVDIDLSLLHPSAKALQPPNLTFMEGDNKEIEKVLSSDFFSAQPHPIIVIEDSHENFDELVMQHFHHHLMPGDYLVCEDTSPDIPSTLDGGIGVGDGYTDNGLAKLHSWKTFLETSMPSTHFFLKCSLHMPRPVHLILKYNSYRRGSTPFSPVAPPDNATLSQRTYPTRDRRPPDRFM